MEATGTLCHQEPHVDADHGYRNTAEVKKSMISGSECSQDRPFPDPRGSIKGFIRTRVTGRGLDQRTGEAYRIDLELFYKWLDQKEGRGMSEEAEDEKELSLPRVSCSLLEDGNGWQEKMEAYLEYLTLEKKLRPATVARKARVFNYYLSYLVRQGILQDGRPLKQRWIAGESQREEWDASDPTGADGPVGTGRSGGADSQGDAGGIGYARNSHTRGASDRMSKTDVDSFFLALEREYDGLNSDFRRRVCLRDLVMMELLFYHGIEVSELLRLEVSDYDREIGLLTVRKKQGKMEGIYLYSKALRERLERWIEEHGEFERVVEYKGRLFLSKLGRPLSMKMVINIFEKYRALAGIEKKVTPKDLKKCMGGYARELMREWCE